MTFFYYLFMLLLGAEQQTHTSPVSSPANTLSRPDDAFTQVSHDHREQPRFRIRQTPHFVLTYNVNSELANDLADRLEQTCSTIRRFCEANLITMQPPVGKMEAIFFDRKEDYDRYCAGISFPSAGTYGVYDRTADRSAFYNIAGSPEMAGINKTLEAIQTGIAALENELRGTEDQPPTTIHILTVNGQSLLLTRQELKSRVETARWELRKIRIRQADYIERINFTVIQHETAHQVLHNIGVLSSIMEKPRWLVEGLACLFETPFDLTSKDIVRVNHFRLKDLIASITGDNHSRKPTLADLQKAITDGRCVSLRRLITEPDLLLEDGPRRSSYYAVAWSLTYFLNRAYPVSFAAYLRDLAGRSKGSLFSVDQEIALLEKHFGPLNDAFVAEWSTFVLKLDSDTNVDQNDSMASAPGIDRPTTNPER